MSMKRSGLLRSYAICTGNLVESCLRLAREDSTYFPQPCCMFPAHLSPIERRHQLTRTEIAASSPLSLHTVEWKLLMLCSDAIWSHFFSSSQESPWCHFPPVISPLLSPLGWLTHCSHHFFTASLLLTTSTSTILIPLTHTLCVSLYQQLLEITSCLPPRHCGLHSLRLELAGAC